MEKIFLNQLNSLNNIFIRLLSEEATETNFKFKFYKLFNYFIDFAMIIAPSLTYVFQIIKFNKTKSSQGFSKFICLLIFLGNLLRVFFWFGKKFKKNFIISINIDNYFTNYISSLFYEIPKQKIIFARYKSSKHQ